MRGDVMVLAKSIQPVRADFPHRLLSQHETKVGTRPPRILIIEDDCDVRESLSALLTECGFEILQAKDGMLGLARAERDAPDLVLLDLLLPQRSGIFVLDQLKARRIRRIPVIMMSGSRDARHRELSNSHGADGYLLKPFQESQFEDLARTLLPNWDRPAPINEVPTGR